MKNEQVKVGVPASNFASRGLKPRGARNPVVMTGATRVTPYRLFDAGSDGLHSIHQVLPASLQGTRVSTDGVSDGWHLLVEATALRGDSVYLLVCRRGWIPVQPIEVCEGVDRNGRTVKFSFSAEDIPGRRDGLCLSYQDRARIASGILREFMDPPDWDQIRASRGQPY